VLEDLPNDAEIATRQGIRDDVDRLEFDAAAAERFRNALYNAWDYVATDVSGSMANDPPPDSKISASKIDDSADLLRLYER
jgi:hypothetical protein